MSPSVRTWFRLRPRIILLLLVLILVGGSGYSYWAEYREQAVRKARELMAPEVGATCSIELRDNQVVTGVFIKLNDEWIVLREPENSEAETWIPRQNVQQMRVEP